MGFGWRKKLVYDEEYQLLVSKVDWQLLKTSYGSAAHVPEAIYRIYTSKKDSVRDDNYWMLDNYIVCQRDLYESAYWALDLVFWVLERKDGEGKGLLLDLILEIGLSGTKDTIIIDGEETDLLKACGAKIWEKRSLISGIYINDDMEEWKAAMFAALDRLLATR
jgi:hypothetical protein